MMQKNLPEAAIFEEQSSKELTRWLPATAQCSDVILIQFDLSAPDITTFCSFKIYAAQRVFLT